jgi:hypothetical protein
MLVAAGEGEITPGRPAMSEERRGDERDNLKIGFGGNAAVR